MPQKAVHEFVSVPSSKVNIHAGVPASQARNVNGNSTGTIAVANGARIHCDNRPVYKASTIEMPDVLQLNITSEATPYSDEALVIFNKAATAQFDDAYDAFKIRGLAAAPQLYTDWYGTEYSVNTLQEINENLSIPLNVEVGIDALYQLEANTGNLAQGTVLYLEDLKLNKFQNLMENPVYSFAANTQDEAGRFLLHFGAPDGTEELVNQDAINVFSFKKDIHIQTPQGFSGEARIYDMLGQEIMAQRIYNEETIITIDGPADYYIVKVISANQDVSTYKVFIK